MNYSFQQQQRKPPLVRYSTQNRAILLSSVNSMPKARRTRAASARRPRRKRSQVATSRRGGGNKVRIVKGRVVVKVGGYPGTHRFGAGQLIRFVPLNKIKQAAKRILGSTRRAGRVRRRRVKKSRRGRRRRRV